MKKIILITILILIAFVSQSQTKNWTIEAFKEFILTSDSLRGTTQIDVNDTILATQQYVLNTAGTGNGWDSLTWNNLSGQIVWWYAGSRIDSMNIDNRYVLLSDSTSQYLTADSINNLVAQSGMKDVFEMELPAATTVAGRISGATLPAGWSIAASGVDLIVTHSLTRRVASVSIFSVAGTEEQQLFNTAAYNGIITTTTEILKIQSLATINKIIKVYIIFV